MLKGYRDRLKNAFGYKFIFLIFIAQCLIKGVCFVIFTEGMLPIFRNMGLDAIQIQVYGAVALSPWTFKPLVGVLSDLIAINGLHKKYAILFACLLGISGSICMVIGINIPVIMVLFLVFAHFQISVLDLLIEAKYAEKMRDHPETGSDIQTLASGFQQAGFLIALSFVGPLADLQLFRVTSIIGLCLTVTPLLPVFFNWLPEVPIPNAPYILLDTKQIRENWRIITVVAVTGISAPAMAAIAAFAAKWLGLACASIVMVVVLIGGFLSMPHPIIARVALFQVLTQVSRVRFSSVLDFFFIADPVCLPGGPNFSYKFYITTTGLAGCAASLSTVFLYQYFLSKWKFRSVLIFTALLSGLGGIFDYIIVKRWNVPYIPDWIFFLIGDDVLSSVVDTLFYIPSASIIGKVCPKGMESSTYAYLAGIANFGSMISVITGALLAEIFGIKTTGVCNWDYLPMLLIVGHVICMLVISIPASCLIPNVAQDADMLKTNPAPISGDDENSGWESVEKDVLPLDDDFY